MRYLSLFSCFWPIVLLLLVAPSIHLLWAALVRPSRGPREAACGKCGYPVAGLTSVACPECGTDWRVAGISTPWLIMRHRGSTAGAVFAWTVLAISAGTIALSVIGLTTAVRSARSMATGTGGAAATPMVWTTPLTPASKAYTSVDVATSSTMGMRPGKVSVDLKLTLNSGAVWTMSVDGATKAAVVKDPAGAATMTTYGPISVAAFYTAAGLGTAAAAEAAELQRIVDLELMSPYTQPGQMALTTFTPGLPTFSGASAMTGAFAGEATGLLVSIVVGGIIWLVFYLVGLWLILRRRRKVVSLPAPGLPAGAPELPAHSPGM